MCWTFVGAVGKKSVSLLVSERHVELAAAALYEPITMLDGHFQTIRAPLP